MKMQAYQNFYVPQAQPIATHLGRQIFLLRVVIDGLDRGLWLHWHDPVHRGRKAAVKYGQVVSPNGSLDEALQLAYQTIEATVELETLPETMPSNLLSFPTIAGLAKAS